LTNAEEAANETRVIAFAQKTFNKTVGYSEDGKVLDFKELQDGELVLLRNRIGAEIQKTRAESEL